MNDEMWIFKDKGMVLGLINERNAQHTLPRSDRKSSPFIQYKIQFKELDFTTSLHSYLFTKKIIPKS